MTEIDWVFLAVMAISVFVGIWRGVVCEFLSVVGWVIGVVMALRYAGDLAQVIPLESLALPIRTVIAAVVIGVLCVFAIGLLGVFLKKLMAIVRVTAEDRLLGAIFGVARGLLIVSVAVFLAGLTSFTSTQTWQKSVTVPIAEQVISFSEPYLPEFLVAMRKNS